ncbi:MAG: hypothetical protein HZB29_08375 [Nitrospinae bacterium]|nr:hypothetical protein [Nitrospinota bacterium]
MIQLEDTPLNWVLVIGGGVALLALLLALWIPFLRFLIRLISKSYGLAPNEDLLKNGNPGEATILQVAETGTYINRNPQIEMLLDVRPQSGSPYQMTLRKVVGIVNIPQFQPGAVYPVKIARDNLGNLEFDIWDLERR